MFGRLGALTIAPAAVTTLANAIQTQEGYYPGSLAYQNNNPGNLVYAGQPGASRGAGGFAQFQTYDQGRAALENQITLDATRGTDVNGNPTTTVSELLASWAPASDPANNVPAYIASVTSQTGYDPNAPLSSLGSDGSGGFSLSDILAPTDISTQPLADSSVGLWLAAGLAAVVLASAL